QRTMNHQDLVPGQEPGSEGFIHWHDHLGLLAHQLHSSPTDRTTTKMTYRPPHRALLQGQGEADLPLELEGCGVCSAGRKKMLGESPPLHIPMESVSTTHRDYCARGCQLKPLPTTQPHNYRTEQPCTFWLEQAHSLPGVTSIRSGDSPFRRNAAFSTPITEYLGQPLPCATLSSQIWSHKQ
ncbi:SPAG8 protein, partial [Ardeotis kori]|nr:SPAG8 protein [Ardeotis kori]